MSPFAGEEREEFPLINRLLANPRLRARYVAHVRTIANQWLDWKVIGPVIEDYRALIDKEIDADTRKLSSYAEFVAIPANQLIPVPDDLPLETACVIADALSTPYHAVKTSSVEKR